MRYRDAIRKSRSAEFRRRANTGGRASQPFAVHDVSCSGATGHDTTPSMPVAALGPRVRSASFGHAILRNVVEDHQRPERDRNDPDRRPDRCSNRKR
jgi:hypothetical protein